MNGAAASVTKNPSVGQMSDNYLNAPFKDKERVKALGAKWDPDQRQWYVPAGHDLAPFSTWLTADTQPTPSDLTSTNRSLALEPTGDGYCQLDGPFLILLCHKNMLLLA